MPTLVIVACGDLCYKRRSMRRKLGATPADCNNALTQASSGDVQDILRYRRCCTLSAIFFESASYASTSVLRRAEVDMTHVYASALAQV